MAELIKVNAPVRKPLFEGVQGENESRSIQFDITPWVEELGDGAVTATAKRSQDSQPYPVTVTKDGTTVTWKPTSTDTAFAGVGSFQLEYTVDSVLAKTCIWSTMVAPSLDPAGDPPDPYDNWLAEMRQIAADALQDAQDADASAQDAEAWAKGTKNGTPVSSSDAQYQNNAKYWAEQSAANAASISEFDRLVDVSPTEIINDRYINASTGAETLTYSYKAFRIRVTPSTKYLYRTGANEGTAGCAFYDENDQFIANSGVLGTTDFSEVTVPAGAVYGRFCYRVAYLTSDNCLKCFANLQRITDVLNVSAEQADQLANGNIKILSANDPTVYKKSYGLNGTHSYDFNSATVTSVSGGAGRTQLILFGRNATTLEFDSEHIGINNTLNFEFDVEGTGTSLLAVFTAVDSSYSKNYNIESGKHYKLSFPLVDFNYFLISTPISDGKTIIIKNLVAYQGDVDINTNFYIKETDNSVKGKVFLSIGDSLTNAGGGGDGAQNLRWQTGIVEKYQMKEYSTSGAIGALVANIGSNTIYSQVMAMQNDPTVGLVSFWGGTNDWGGGVQLGDFETQLDPNTRDNTTFYGGLLDCVEKILTLYPSIPFFLVGTTQRVQSIEQGITSNNTPNSIGKYLHEYVDAVKKVAEYYSIPFLDLYRKSGISEYTASVYFYPQESTGGGHHYLHFSDEGEKQIARVTTAFVSSTWDFEAKAISF